MSSIPAFNAPPFGDDGFMPDRRGWMALPLTIMLWAVVFTITFFALRNEEFEDSLAADGYIGWLLITFIIIVFFIIPTAAILLGRPMDEATTKLPPLRAGLYFGLTGLALGVIPAALIYFINSSYGWVPFPQFIVPSFFAPFITRLTLDYVAARRALGRSLIIATVVVIVASLSIGVSVFSGIL